MILEMTLYICKSCSLCLTSKMRKPIGLPCGHTFCSRCIRIQYTEKTYFKCLDCSTKHKLHFDHYPINQAILSKIHYNNSLYLNNKSNPNSDIDNRIYRSESFSIINGIIAKKIPEKIIYPSLYNYFEVMRMIITYPSESNNLFKKFLKILYIPFIILLLIFLNYIFLTQMRFAEIYLVVCTLFENEDNTDQIIKKTKLWMSFVTLHLVNNCIEYLWMTTWSLGMNALIVFRTVYVILVLLNDNTLNTVVYQLLTVLKEINILVQ